MLQFTSDGSKGEIIVNGLIFPYCVGENLMKDPRGVFICSVTTGYDQLVVFKMGK